MKYFRNNILIIILVISYSGKAQDTFTSDIESQITSNATNIWFDENSNSLKYIEFSNVRVIGSNKSRLNTFLNLPEDIYLQEVARFNDKKGFKHIKCQITYKLVPVEGGIINLHLKSDSLISASGNWLLPIDLNVNPHIPATEAAAIAARYLNSEDQIPEAVHEEAPIPELIILKSAGKYKLCYKVDIYLLEPFTRKYIYVDAVSGDVLKVISRIQDATGIAHTLYNGVQEINTKYEAGNYSLFDDSRTAIVKTLNMHNGYRFSESTFFADADNIWDDETNYDNAATNVYYALQASYDYFWNTFERNSVDNYGKHIASYVHFGTGYNNAFWDGNVFVFGDGDDETYMPFASTDVVAHEYTHAITEYSAGLEYYGESGALNESFSDIFGVVVDFYTNPGTANYLLGDDYTLKVQALRNMANPKQFGDPQTYKGQYWVFGTEDNGGIHTNNGVQNYWFYLLAEGGSGINDFDNDYLVKGIGREKAAAIAYRSLTVYLTQYSQYADARFFSIQSAIDLYGPCSDEVIAVTNAWHAVGVGNAFSNQVFANFHTDRNYSCSGTEAVSFMNTSTNADSFQWFFGDGSVSTDMSPVHIYSEPGVYSVKLIAHGNNLCGYTDSLTSSELIHINPGDDMLPAAEVVISESSGDFGIKRFSLNSTICNSELSITEGEYVDNTCKFAFYLDACEMYSVEVLTGSTENENVTIWIDLNNNGTFTDDEQVWNSSDTFEKHSGELYIPEPDVYNIPLRMRVLSDIYTQPVTSSGTELYAGQAEDYRVVIRENTQAPLAQIEIKETIIGIGDTISFYDCSLHLPTTWEWYFTGVDTSISEIINPVVSFSQAGYYSITLVVSNQYGIDSITLLNAIKVLPAYCLGNSIRTTEQEGILYDDGAHSKDYSSNVHQGFLIQPKCATHIKLEFLNFDTENTNDILKIYEGDDTSGNIILEVSGNVLPEPLTIASGSIFVEFTSNTSINNGGFSIHWEATVPENTPFDADFSISDINVAIGQKVFFTDANSSIVEKIWDFGDSVINNCTRVEYIYHTPGVKEIKLVSSNCYYTDSITKTIQVMQPATMTVDQHSIFTVIEPNVSKQISLGINNVGEGELIYGVQVNNRSPESAHLKRDNLQNTEPLLNYRFSNSNLSNVLNNFINSSDSIVAAIPGAVLFEEGEDGYFIANGGGNLYEGGNFLSTNYGEAIPYSQERIALHHAFGDSGSYFTCKQPGIFLMAADLDDVDYFEINGNLGADGNGNVDGSVLEITSNLKSYTGFIKRVYQANVPSVNHLILVPGTDIKINHSISENTNSDNHRMHNLNAANRIYYLMFVSEKGAYIPDSVMQVLMYKFVTLLDEESSWMHINDSQCKVNSGLSSELELQLSAYGLNEGTYRADIQIASNDSKQPELIVPVTMYVGKGAVIEAQHNPDMGITTVDKPITRTVLLHNSGNIPLHINNVKVKNSKFGISIRSSDIAVGENGLVDITYNPGSLGCDTALILIESNAVNQPVYELMLWGAVYKAIAPEVIYMPGSIERDVNEGSFAIDLNEIFKDPQKSSLEYSFSSSKAEIIYGEISVNSLGMSPAASGVTQITLTATNSYGLSTSISFDVVITEKDVANNNAHINAFPNPADSYLTLRCNNIVETMAVVQLLTTSGNVILSYKVDVINNDFESIIDLTSYGSGLYQLMVQHGDTVESKRIIIQ